MNRLHITVRKMLMLLLGMCGGRVCFDLLSHMVEVQFDMFHTLKGETFHLKAAGVSSEGARAGRDFSTLRIG